MTLTLELEPEIEDRLCRESKRLGVDPTEVVRRLIESAIPERETRYEEVIATLDKWDEEDDEQEQRETLEFLKKALNENRTSYRRVFK